MGLRDTIDAARQEAKEAGGIFSGNDEDSKKNNAEEQEGSSSGYSKRSAARAKPATAAASSVRVVSAEDARHGKSGKNRSEMTKEERKAERNNIRDAEDRMNMAGSILLKKDAAYQRTQRVWWTMLGVGVALTLTSFVINHYLRSAGDGVQNAEVFVAVSLVSMVIAYVFIIGAFVYDLVKARPIRKRIDAEVKGMSKRRLEEIIREDDEARKAEAKAKEEKKQSKKNKKEQ